MKVTAVHEIRVSTSSKGRWSVFITAKEGDRTFAHILFFWKKSDAKKVVPGLILNTEGAKT